MNSTSSWTAEAQQTRHGVYFFLSYAHSAPTSERVRSDSDPSVGVFFADLAEAVAARAKPAEGMEIGFFDQQIQPGADMKALLSEALGSAEVFVPLYSPGYVAKSWPMREQEVFRRRLRVASAVAPDQHIIPILWTPFPSWEQPSIMARALSIGAGISDYGENGLRALCVLTSYRRSYQLVLSRLADEIVTVAERFPLGPSAAPDLDDVPGPATAEAGFLVAMLAPKHGVSRTPQAVKGGEDPWWRTYAEGRIPPVAEYAGSVAERLGLETRVADFAEVEELFDRTPAIVIVDPWLVADRGPEFLTSTFAGLPEWVVPLILVEQRGDPSSDPPVTKKAVEALDSALQVPVNRVNSMDQLDELLPTVVARARRTYLREGRVFPPVGPSKRPGRLRDEDLRNVEGSETDE
ncbi:MAG: toll/interleukin-1 receptor domain-containing protein [Actinobacteria bacterium]|nr:toll/interleukin-1 receptor domain-containing protein [Actinomycetota bacterium]